MEAGPEAYRLRCTSLPPPHSPAPQALDLHTRTQKHTQTFQVLDDSDNKYKTQNCTQSFANNLDTTLLQLHNHLAKGHAHIFLQALK